MKYVRPQPVILFEGLAMCAQFGVWWIRPLDKLMLLVSKFIEKGKSSINVCISLHFHSEVSEQVLGPSPNKGTRCQPRRRLAVAMHLTERTPACDCSNQWTREKTHYSNFLLVLPVQHRKRSMGHQIEHLCKAFTGCSWKCTVAEKKIYCSTLWVNCAKHGSDFQALNRQNSYRIARVS